MSSRDRDAPVARFVERELRAYLECGVLAHGAFFASTATHAVTIACSPSHAKGELSVLRAGEDAWPTPPLISWIA